MLTRDQDTAEDLVQEAFVRLYRAGSRLDPIGLPAYARRTIVNLSRTAHRRRRGEAGAADRAALAREAGHDPDEAYDMRRRIMALPHGQRACLALRYYEDMADAQIAETLGVSGAAVRKQIERAIKTLRRDMAPRTGA